MKKLLALVLLSVLGGNVLADTKFYELNTPEESTRVALSIEGDEVYGSKSWIPAGDVHGAEGTFSGTVKDGLITAVYQFIIEGSDQSEEVVFKLDGETLSIGEGELVEGEAGLLKLKAPDEVTFEKSLKEIKVATPAPGTSERKAIMDAMRGPVAAHVGKAIEFTGDLLSHEGWARFSGNVATKDGTTPENENAAFMLELDFFALLKQDYEGKWQVMSWGFSGDIGARLEAAEKFPDASWPLLH
jgi:phage gp45-like